MTNNGFTTKSTFCAGLMIALALGSLRAQDPNTNTNKTPAQIENLMDKVSYGVGMTFGNQIKRAGFEVDMDVVMAAMKETLAGKEGKYSEVQVREAIMAYQQELRGKREGERVKIAEKNKQDGEKFLAENKTKSGVKTHTVKLADGTTAEMQYKVLAEGTGSTPKEVDTVTVNYRGTFLDGKEFDSSAKHGAPLKRQANQLVRGWVEALQMMKTGSKWQLFLPASLAYGDNGGPGIEPGSTLIFDVELLSVEPATPPAAVNSAPAAAPLTSDIIKVPSAEELKRGAKIEVIKAEDAAKMVQQQQGQAEKK